jgi:hypothetical protein
MGDTRTADADPSRWCDQMVGWMDRRHGDWDDWHHNWDN